LAEFGIEALDRHLTGQFVNDMAYFVAGHPAGLLCRKRIPNDYLPRALLGEPRTLLLKVH
jgi:hypothetical protein